MEAKMKTRMQGITGKELFATLIEVARAVAEQNLNDEDAETSNNADAMGEIATALDCLADEHEDLLNVLTTLAGVTMLNEAMDVDPLPGPSDNIWNPVDRMAILIDWSRDVVRTAMITASEAQTLKERFLKDGIPGFRLEITTIGTYGDLLETMVGKADDDDQDDEEEE
jgi:hypothetical protein